jgi:hypothetical protein
MALIDDTEREVQALALEVRQRVAALNATDEAVVLRRLITILKMSTRDADRERVKERARLIAVQGARCAVCQVPFADSPAATRGATDRLLCSPCLRESRIPPPPR